MHKYKVQYQILTSYKSRVYIGMQITDKFYEGEELEQQDIKSRNILNIKES